MKKQLLYIGAITCLPLFGAEKLIIATVEDFYVLDQAQRVRALKNLAVRMAERLPRCFNAELIGENIPLVQKAVAEETKSREMHAKYECKSLQCLRNIYVERDFKYHLFYPIFNNTMYTLSDIRDAKSTSASSNEWRQRWLKIACDPQRPFDEAFNNDFVQRIAQGCSKDESDNLLRYFRSALFCMRLFQGASQACDLWYSPAKKDWFGRVVIDSEEYPFYPALHREIIRWDPKIDLEPIKDKAQLLYDSMRQKYGNLSQIDSAHLLDPYDGQIPIMTVTYQ